MRVAAFVFAPVFALSALPAAHAAESAKAPKKVIAFEKILVLIPTGAAIGSRGNDQAGGVRQPIQWTPEMLETASLEAIAAGELNAAGYGTSAREALFGTAAPIPTRWRIGGIASDLSFYVADTAAGSSTRVSITVEWSVFDRVTEQVVFTKKAEGFAHRSRAMDFGAIVTAIQESLTTTLKSSAFVQFAAQPAPKPSAAVAVITPCLREPAKTLDAVVSVQGVNGRALGVLVSPDGWLLAAFHPEGAVSVRLWTGLTLEGTVVRKETTGLSLLRVPGTGHACMPPSQAGAALAVPQDVVDRLLGN